MPIEIHALLIDGDQYRQGCEFDYRDFASRLLPRGILVFHDYWSGTADWGGTKVIDDAVVPSGHYKHIELCDSFCIGREIQSIS